MKKRKGITEKDVQRWLGQGFGQGSGIAYKPFFYVRDVPSPGRSTMIEGLKVKRTHHYLSDLEFAFHILAEFDSEVLNIREQFALLPWLLTQAIAQTLGIKHPTYPGTSTPIVMTSDLVKLVDRPDCQGLEVVSVKAASALGLKSEDDETVTEDVTNDKEIIRTLEKLLIEKAFWTIQGARWSLQTELDLPLNKVKNLIMFRNSLVSREMDYLNLHLLKFPELFLQVWDPTLSLNTLLDETGHILNLEREECFVLLGRSVWLHLLSIDLDTEEICHQMPVRLTEFAPAEDR